MRFRSVESLLKSGLLKLDVEFGNSHGFFSATKAKKQLLEAESGEINYEASFQDANLSVTDSCSIGIDYFDRKVNFEIASESRLYDLVSRYVVLSNERSAEISGITIRHTNSNIYYQYSASKTIVPIGNDDYIQFGDIGTTQHESFDNVFYVRDEATESNGMRRWIVHHRMIVKEEALNLIVRCCHPIWNRPVPAQSLIPNFIKRQLFRIRERRYPNFPFMAVGEVSLPSGQLFDIKTRIKLLND
jgi:hypothetical protein